ncbi:MAG: class II glutamine amidotransferase [Candidatus Protistobacter heckmanni]|nr:class II glutamine amidotransferase [Candidatus Protistobacter heckmanni]
MCQLLGMNCVTPTDITFSFTGFAARGGKTAQHADGFGVAFFEDKACRLFIDDASSATSPIAELVKRYPIKSKNVISHIRKATQGSVGLENTHPFMRELWGRHWIFAHNGDLQEFQPRLTGLYHPVGDTDSEAAFCLLLQGLRKRFPGSQPPLPELFHTIEEITREISRYGIFNFLLSNGQALFAFCSTNLYYIVRQWPFSIARLLDTEVEIDFSQTNVENDRVSVIATMPLTSNETWTQFEAGQLLMFQDGRPVRESMIEIPEAVKKRNAERQALVGG